MADGQDKASPGNDSAALERLMKVLWIGGGVGLAGVAAAHAGGPVAAAGIGVLIFLAAFASGSFLGFLFGVPRVLSREAAAASPETPRTPASGGAVSTTPEAPAAPTPSDAPPAAPTAGARLLQSNTNLERISDWLTTMLVGAGLVELHRINEGLLAFRTFLATTATVFVDSAGTPNAGVLPAVGPIVLVFGVACGFLYMYLNTRLVLVRLFHAIETLLSGGAKLSASEQRAVKAVVNEGDGTSNFVTQQLSAKRALTVEDALSVMFDLLYKADPDRVIELGAQLSNTDAVRRPDYWFYLAAAFGQKLHHLDAKSAEWLSARDNALDCARRAVALNPLYRDRLWRISDPNSTDNDLAPLREDEAFLRIVDRR